MDAAGPTIVEVFPPPGVVGPALADLRGFTRAEAAKLVAKMARAWDEGVRAVHPAQFADLQRSSSRAGKTLPPGTRPGMNRAQRRAAARRK